MVKLALVSENARDYGHELAKGVANFAQRRSDWTLELFNPTDVVSNRDVLHGIDGLISHVNDERTCRILRDLDIPIVNTFAKSITATDVSVDCDHAEIARIAAHHFLKRRFQNFAFCGFPGLPFSDPREHAFTDLVAANGHEPCVFRGKNLTNWVKRLPRKCAIFCANDVRAYQVIQTALSLERPVPSDLAVLGSDNDTIICAFSPVPISSIDPNARGVGFAAARLLDAALKDPLAHKNRPVFFVKPTGLIERASTSAYQIEPDWLGRLLLFIDDSLAENLSSADIVAKSGYSYPVVEKTFRKNFGETVADYLLRIRMEKAEQLLSEGNLTSKEVAVRLGFRTPQHFCTVFRRHFGHTPTEHGKSLQD